jgi:hypothetical protein
MNRYKTIRAKYISYDIYDALVMYVLSVILIAVLAL